MALEYFVDLHMNYHQQEAFEWASLIHLDNLTSKRQISLTPRERMFDALNGVWANGDDSLEKEWMVRLWKILFKDVTLANWTALRENMYVVALTDEFIGKFKHMIGCKVILKKQIIVDFREEPESKTGLLQKVIAFPKGGLAGRLGFGWLSKDIPIEKIIISRPSRGNDLYFTIVHSLGQKRKEAQRALEIWEGIEWHPNG